MSKKVWFSLPVDFSPELNSSEVSHIGGEFHRLLEDSEEVSELSQYSYNTPHQSQSSVNQFPQYSYNTPPKAQQSASELSQYSVNTMDTNSTNETYSTNESQDISTSQQSSEANLSQSGLDDGNSVASSMQESQQEEAVNSAIMEVSGDLMLGKLTQQKYPSGGSESSDISDDDSRRMAAGGSIVKYPESSTGLSDNDWNPYATDTDTNQTPRSAASDELRYTAKDPVTTVSMVTGEVTTSESAAFQSQLQSSNRNVSDDYRIVPSTESESYKPRYRDDTSEHASQVGTDSRSGRLDILRYMIDDSNTRDLHGQDNTLDRPGAVMRSSPTDSDDEGRRSVESTKSSKSDVSEPSQRSHGGFSKDSEETLKARDSLESAMSLQLAHEIDLEPQRLSLESNGSEENSKRESVESARSHHTEGSGRRSADSGRSDEYRRESAESYKSLPAEDYGRRSGRQSSEASRSPRSGYQSVESWRSPRSELDKSGESHGSGRESAESQHSVRSDRSRGSQRSRSSAGSVVGPDRLDKLNDVGDSIKELIELESAQRQQVDITDKRQEKSRQDILTSGDLARRVKLSEKFEAYTAPTRSLKSPTSSGSLGYVSVAEREKLLSQSPDHFGISRQTLNKSSMSYKPDPEFRDGYQPESKQMSARTDGFHDVARSPSEVSMKRVSDLFEETKKQSRAAVSLPRPDPSGSEERFPLRERLSLSQHADDSFKSHDRTGHSGISEKSRDSETARSITSEEVARVLGKHVDTEKEQKRTRTEADKENRTPGIRVSAFDKVDRNTNAPTGFDGTHHAMSDDEIAKRVRAILSDTEYLGIVGENSKTLQKGGIQSNIDPSEKYIPHTIDYSKLQRDLQEIQDSLLDVPAPKANDSLYQFRQQNDAEGDQNLSETSDSGHFKSAETTSTSGRESGISNFGRKLAWDHAADLQYDEGYTGQFYGTMSSLDTDTLAGTQRLRKSGTSESDNLVVRAESTTTNESENDNDPQTEDTVTAAAQSIVDQVLSRHAEGPLQETVEDIIARYKNERQDLFDRFQPGKDKATGQSQYPKVTKETQVSVAPATKLSTQRSSAVANINHNAVEPVQSGDSQPGLAERVYKILTSDQQTDSFQAPPPHLEQGMAKKVYKILSSERPASQVNGILTDAMEKEHEMLKKLVQQQEAEKDDSSLEVPPRLNGTSDSFTLSEKDVRRQLEWSLLSSPEKGDKTGLSDFSMIRKVTSAPYNSVDTAKTLLSTQMQKMSQQNFDKSVELRTPYRQAIDCYPIYGMERDGKKQEPEQRGREAWMPVPNPSKLSPEKAGDKRDALASERFFLTHKDGSPLQAHGEHTESPQRHRTYSDPFEIPPNRKMTERGYHPRSKSEGPADVSDLSQYSFESGRYDPTNRRAASSSHRLRTGDERARGDPDDIGLVTPAKHKPQAYYDEKRAPHIVEKRRKQEEWSYEPYTSDSSDMYYHSDSSESQENKWHNHGYQLYKPSDNPLFKPYNNQAYKSPKKNYSFSTYRDFKKNYLSQKGVSERQSRSRVRENRIVDSKPKQKIGNFSASEKESAVPSSKKPMLSKDAVYDLLSKSRAQEMKVAEFQNKNHEFKAQNNCDDKIEDLEHEVNEWEYKMNDSENEIDSKKPKTNGCEHKRDDRKIKKSGPNVAENYGNTQSQHLQQYEKPSHRNFYRYSGHESISPTESDSSGSRKLSRLRPYRPSGSRDVYYTESGDDTNDSGTTIESTHPGSDDAVPPYIPSQYLGSRKDEPTRHPTGIYSNSSKEALSTIDEKSVGDEREKASSASSGKNSAEPKLGRETDAHLRSRTPNSDRNKEPVTKNGVQPTLSDLGYQTGTTAKSSYEDERSREAAELERRRDAVRLRELELKRKLDDIKERGLDRADLYSGTKQENIDNRLLKSREEYLHELEARERENLLRLQYSDEKRDPLGTTVRSDPGGSLDDRRDSNDLAEFRRLEPEPLYPQEKIRYSRSRSETDLNALSPTESQKYSSPMQPGTRFMELSSQPSPISHHESLRAREPVVTREPERQIGPPASRKAKTLEGQRDPARESSKDRFERTGPNDKNIRHPDTRAMEGDRAAYVRTGLDSGYPLELPRVDNRQHYPMELPAVTGRGNGEDEREVELSIGKDRRQPKDKSKSQRAISPLHVREKELERELEEMNREIAAQVKEAQGKAIDDTEEFEDNFPPSKKAQVLREVLEQEYVDGIPPNINDMWTRFKELNDQTHSESSLNSTRLDTLAGLLKNPAHHAVNSFLSEKAEEQERKKLEAEEAERLKAERQAEIENEKKLAAERAAKERILKRQELRQQQQRLSEEESNGSYTEILMERERKERVKGSQRKKEVQSSKEKKTKTPDREKAPKKSRKEKENKGEENSDEKQEQSREKRREILSMVANMRSQHSDSMDTLFSIPEDASFETSPTKSESDLKARQKRHRHVIDPLMKKLRDKIKLQRDKIDKERRKELQRVAKLKKLEMLLTAKRKGKLSDKAIDVELENVSSTTSVSHSESSLMSSEATLTAGSTAMESDGSSQGSTTLKESSVDSPRSPKLQYKKYPETEGFATPKKHYPETDSSATHSETSDFSNIIVERVPEKQPERKSKKARSKEKKPRAEDSGRKGKKERKEKKMREVFGVELSDELLAKQVQRYERYLSPEKIRKQRDAATMYPSPITVSPPSRRRLRDVYMKSEAIQTSPSVRSTSPCHAYDEVPVAPVPLMGEVRLSNQSVSLERSSATQRRISRSPADKSRSRSAGSRKSSKSPSAETQTDISSPVIKSKTGSQTRKKKPQSPMWKPETPPKNSMFEPETPDENREPFTKDEDIPHGLSWFIPLKASQPWRKPLKERQAFSVSQEPWEPKSVPQSTWKNIVHGDILREKSDVSNISRDTKFDLDTTGQPVRDEESMSESEESDEDVLQSKPLSKMSLQEAFMHRKQSALSGLRERQKRLHLAAEERKMQAYLQLERDRLFQEQKKKEANPEAHPYSDNLFKPSRRVISKEEMKEMTQKKYKKLPEVVEKDKLKKRADQYSLNRLKARLFNRKVQRYVLVKAQKWGQ